VYLRWRYAQVPGLDYRALWSFHGSAGAAVIVRSRLRRGFREIVVAEILATPGDAGTRLASEILRDLCRRVDSDYVVAITMPRTPERSAARRAGFLPTAGLGPIFTVRVLDRALAIDPYRVDAWRLTAGDLEIF
jgi:hypothetical protein